MKLFHTIVHYDLYVLAADRDAAFVTARAAIDAGLEAPAEMVALEPRRLTDIGPTWVEQAPYIGDGITDEQAAGAGETCGAVFDNLYAKAPPKAPKK